jgi:mannitol-1-phosphate/altronate dehydrogenase
MVAEQPRLIALLREKRQAASSHPAIRHLCLQIAVDGSQKMPRRIFATAADALARSQSGALCLGHRRVHAVSEGSHRSWRSACAV